MAGVHAYVHAYIYIYTHIYNRATLVFTFLVASLKVNGSEWLDAEHQDRLALSWLNSVFGLEGTEECSLPCLFYRYINKFIFICKGMEIEEKDYATPELLSIKTSIPTTCLDKAYRYSLNIYILLQCRAYIYVFTPYTCVDIYVDRCFKCAMRWRVAP
jgi:hypothetical protein